MPNLHRCLFYLIFSIGLAAFIPQASATLNDTGITTCSNATQNGLPCPVAGFPGQDAEYGTNGFNFTKLDTNGNALPASATNHVCVRDNVTGLTWEVKTNDGGLRDMNKTYTWDNAPSYATAVNAAGLCGFKDWRIPNPKELAIDFQIIRFQARFYKNTFIFILLC